MYCLEPEKSKAPGSSSLGTLKFDAKDNQLAGRPLFHPSIITKMPLKPGEHRRHIISWHKIREFINAAFKKLHNKKLKTFITNKLNDLAGSEILKTAEVLTEKIENGKEMIMAAYIMNSHLPNLWPGAGKENSAINQAQQVLRSEISSWVELKDIFVTLEKWKNEGEEKEEKGKKENLNTAKAKSKAYKNVVRELSQIFRLDLGSDETVDLSLLKVIVDDDISKHNAETKNQEYEFEMVESLATRIHNMLIEPLETDMNMDDKDLRTDKPILEAIERLNQFLEKQLPEEEMKDHVEAVITTLFGLR